MNNRNILKPGTILHETYIVEKHLASGGFGNTYKARHKIFNEIVAIKEFFMADIATRDENGNVLVPFENKIVFNSQMEKFKIEAQRIRKLNNPHIVRVHDIFPDKDTFYYVMDFIEGENLAVKMARLRCPMSESEVIKLLPQILDALQAIHADGLIHMDIKPANLMMDNDGKLILIDFGASKQNFALGKNIMLTAVAYTERYAPLEQVEQNVEKFGPWTDFYALGATLFNLLTNSRPPSPTDILDDITPDKTVSLQMPRMVSNTTHKLIVWLMQISRKLRPQSVDEIINFLYHNNVSVALLKKTKESKSKLPPIINELIKNMVYVEGSTFIMGANFAQRGDAESDELPAHSVTLDSFSIGRYEVTQEEWEVVMGSNPSKFKDAKRPVEKVSWDDCQKFISKLNVMTGKKFRLPTEAEWEFAARGGNNSCNSKYAGSNDIDYVGWYKDNSGSATLPVGLKAPNELGLFDMTGNVWEWCADWYGKIYYSEAPLINPKGPSDGTFRVRRGGSWHGEAKVCRVLRRSCRLPSYKCHGIGLRLAL